MMIDGKTFPLLNTKSSTEVYPTTSSCPICGDDFSEGVAYLSGGIVVDHVHSQTLAKLNPEAFLYIGYHGKQSDMSDSANVSLVEDLKSEQFTIQTCSLKCLRKLFDTIWHNLEAQLENE